MNKRTFLTNGLAALVLAGVMLTPGCALMRGELDQGDVALIALDLQDVAREGTIYALAKEPDWRPNVTLVRDQLAALAAMPDQPTFDALLKVMQGLPFKELQSPEARLAFTAANMTLRRIGRNVNLGNIANIKPLVDGLAKGISEGLAAPPLIIWSPVPQPSDAIALVYP